MLGDRAPLAEQREFVEPEPGFPADNYLAAAVPENVELAAAGEFLERNDQVRRGLEEWFELKEGAMVPKSDRSMDDIRAEALTLLDRYTDDNNPPSSKALVNALLITLNSTMEKKANSSALALEPDEAESDDEVEEGYANVEAIRCGLLGASSSAGAQQPQLPGTAMDVDKERVTPPSVKSEASEPVVLPGDVIQAPSDTGPVTAKTSEGLAAAFAQFAPILPLPQPGDPALAEVIGAVHRVTGSSSDDDAQRGTKRSTDESVDEHLDGV